MRALLYDNVGASIGFVQAECVGEPGNQNHGHRRMLLSQAANEFDAGEHEDDAAAVAESLVNWLNLHRAKGLNDVVLRR